MLKRILKWIGFLVLAAGVIALATLFLLHSYLSSFLADYVRDQTGWSLKVRSAEIRFRPLSIRLEKLELSADGEKPFLTAQTVSAKIPYSSFWGKKFRVKEILLDTPQVDLDQVSRLKTKSTDSKASTGFILDSVIITKGGVRSKNEKIENIHLRASLVDQNLQVQTLTTSVRGFQFKIAGTIADWQTLNLSYEISGNTLTAPSVGIFKRMEGTLTTRGTATGPLKQPLFAGSVEAPAIQLNGSRPFAIQGKYKYDVGEKLHPISIQAKFRSLPLILIRNYWGQMPPTDSTGTGTVEYLGGTDVWDGSGELSMVVQSEGRRAIPIVGNLTASLQKGTIRVARGDFKMLHSTLKASGTVSRNKLSLDVVLNSSQLKDFAFINPRLGSAPGNYHAQVHIAGPYKDLTASGDVEGQLGKSVVRASGTTRTGAKSVSATLQGNVFAEDLRFLSLPVQRGELVFEGEVQGRWNQPVIHANWSGTDLNVNDVNLGQASGEITTKQNDLLWNISAPDFGLSAEGSYKWRSKGYELKGMVEEASLEHLLTTAGETSLPLEGTLNAAFEASGNLARWQDSNGALKVSPSQLKYKDIDVKVENAEIELNKGVAELLLNVETDNAQMNVAGTASLSKGYPIDLKIKGNADANILSRVSRDWRGKGNLNLEATARGRIQNPEIEGRFHTTNFTVGYMPQHWKVHFETAEVILANDTLSVNVSGAWNESKFSSKGIVPMEGGEGELRFEVSDLPLNTLLKNPNVSGTFDISGDMRGKGYPVREWQTGSTAKLPFYQWTGNISIDPRKLKVGDQALNITEPVLMHIADQKLQVTLPRIQLGDLLDLQGSGKVDLATGRIESSAHIDGDLDLLSRVNRNIQSSGPITADVKLGGTLQKLEYSGTVELKNAFLRIPDSPLLLENLQLKALVDSNRIHLERLEARSGGGVISGSGDLIRDKAGSELRFTGKNVAANYPEGLRSQMDFDLKLTAAESKRYLLAGDIVVLRSLYQDELTLKNPLLRKLFAATTALSTEKRFKNQFELDLDIKTRQSLNVRNSLAEIRAGADLKVQGTLYRPTLAGRVNVRTGGRLFLLGNQYDVERATIEFYGSETIDPNLDITLSTLLRDFQTDTFYEVFLPIGGTPSNLEFRNVRSTPSLSEDQIFSLLAEGTVESDQVGNSASIFQRQILTFLAGQALGAPSAKIAKSVGLSRIQVQQEGLSSVNDPKTRLMLGKDIGRGFSLIYSFALNDPDEQTWIATYRYGRNIMGRFIDQDDGTYTVSVSHKIPFGPGTMQTNVREGSRRRQKVGAIEWENSSPFTIQEIQKTLKIEEGDSYDYWGVQDHADELKKELQKGNYLFPVVEVQETEMEPGIVSLAIAVRAGNPATMVFEGYEISEKLLNTYKSFWRNGISAPVTQQMIQDDLMENLHFSGYYEAVVKTRTEEAGSQTRYIFEVSPGPQYESVELAFEGAMAYVPASLQEDLRQLYPASAAMFDEAIHEPDDFIDKVKVLYAQKGYLRTSLEAGSINFDAGSRKIFRAFDIQEGPVSTVSSLILPEDKFFSDSVRGNLQLLEGAIFQPDLILEDELRIRDLYETEGYRHVSVQYNMAFSEWNQDVIVTWSVQAQSFARIASVRVEGNQSTRTNLILEQAGLKEGDVLTKHNQALARKRLSDLGVFRQIRLEADQTEMPDLYDVTIYVVESRKYEFQYGGRYNTDDKFSAEIRLSDFNFFGRAQHVSLYLRSTLDLPLFRLDYTFPPTGSFWDRTRFSLFRDETDEDVRARISGDLVEIPFTKRQTTFQFQQEHRFWTYSRLFWSAEYSSLSADFVDLETRAPITFDGTETLFRAAFVTDRRDDPLNATRGYFFSVDGEIAPTFFGTDIGYRKNFTQFFYFKRIGKIVWASGVRSGFLDIRSNIITVAEKFRTGGSTTVRGFQHNTVIPDDDLVSVFFGGDSVFILNQEIRFPIKSWVSGAAFVDAGNVYLLATDLNPFDLRYSAGVGVRVGAAGFVLRFDFGFNLDQREDEPLTVFHFGIGQAF